MKTSHTRKLLFWIIIAATCLLLSGIALAQVSSNFNLNWHLLSGGGGSRISTNYQVNDSLGQWAAGQMTSENNQVESGFWYGVSPPAAALAGDAFEPDDTCATALPISTDGSKQTHTFHDSGDQDWYTFTALANTTYILETSNVGTQHDAVLYLYGACDTPDLGGDDNAFGQTLRLEWSNPTAATYYVKLEQHDPAAFGDATNYDIAIYTDMTPPSAPSSPRSAPNDQALILQWERPPELDVTSYNICFGTASGFCSGVEQVSGGDTTYYELSGLTNGVRYYVSLTAVDFSNNESASSPEISNIPAVAVDATNPAVTVVQPTSTELFDTTQNIVSLSGNTQDQGGNLSRVRVRNLTLPDAEVWDYSISGSSDTFHIDSLPLAAGNNNVEVTVFDDTGNTGGDALTIQLLGESLGAVIIVAGHNDSFSLQTNIYNAANNAYRVFKGAGFSDENIYYLANAPQDPDSDQTSEVDADATPANLQNAITTWAATGDRVGPGKPLHIYMMDHGLIESFCISGCGSGNATQSTDLDAWLSSLETSTGADTVNVIIEACHSGSFIDRLEIIDSITKAGRVVIASTGATNNAYASAQGAYFSDAFFSCIVESNSLKTCFDQAKTAVEIGPHAQTPWMDDNGDGLSNPSDGTIAQSRYIAASFGSFRPVIMEVSVTLQGSNGTLNAIVERGAADIDQVYAAVYAPSFAEPQSTSLDLGVPLILLQANPYQDGLYSATYPNGFTEDGEYTIVFYTQDEAGIYAQPKVSGPGLSDQFFIQLPLIIK